MKRHILLPVLLALFALGGFSVWAQTLEYSFTQTNTTWTPITGGVVLGTETSDDQRFVDPATPAGGTTTTGPGFDIGFNFTFNGAVFDRLAINNNGWISLGQSALTPSVNNASSSAYTPLASTTTIDPPVLYNRISALARDLQAQTGATLRLETIGTAPNRICVIQWANFKKYGTSGTGDSFSFQIRLNETTNNIQIVYGPFVSNATAGNMQVGLRGPDVADFNARQGATGWDNTTAASANNQYVVLTDVYFPANGLTFNFNFPIANQAPNPANLISPANSAILVSPTATLNWMSGGGLPTGYKLSFGTDNPPTNLVNNQDLGMVTIYDPTPDMQLATTYYWKVIPYNAFGDAANCPVWSFTTHGDPMITTLPYSQNWDLVTPPTLPFDWTNIVQSTSTSAVVATYASTTYAHSQPNCARLYNPSDASATLLLVGPPLATAIPANTVRVRFWARSSGANYPLSLGVLTNPADPATYTELYSIALTTTLTEYAYDLTTYTGTGTYIAFKHGLGGTSRSLYVDDIVFEQIAPNDLACQSISGNTTPSVGIATTYTATVHNWGTAAQSTYTVKLFNGNDVELATAAGVTVAPGANADVSLSWTPTAEGPLALYGKVFLTGDVNPTNDQSPMLNIAVQPAGALMVTVGVGDLAEGVPLEFYYRNSLHEALYFQNELNVFGNITALTFYNNFVTDIPNAPCKFWLGQTTLEDLSGGWILPDAGNLTLVFDGNINFPAGQNTITIPLQTPFSYTAGNLVLYANRPYDANYYSSSDNFQAQTVGTTRARKLYSDSTTYDPLNPSAAGTLSGTFARTSFTVVTSGFAALNGTVTSSGNPVADVDIVINATTLADVTDAAGAYGFPFVQPGQYTVTASKLGYETQTLPVTLVADQTTTLNFNLVSSSTVTVSGTVVGSDQPTVGLAGVEITLDGPLDYNGTTNASGQFSIAGVLSGNAYNYTFVKDGYQDLTGTINVSATNYDMGTVTMNEIALPPWQVTATENTAQTQVSLAWRTPSGGAAGGVEDFEASNGDWVSSGYGDWQWGNNYNVANYVDIDTYTDTPPSAAHSGTGMWGTVLMGGYSNADAWSYLRKTFNLSGFNNPVLDFWHYMDGYNTWDYGLIKVNGTTIWGSSAAAVFMPWQELVIDLSAYANQNNVEISFEWYATSVVSYAGWYIDDLYVGPAQTRIVNYVYAPTPDPVHTGSEIEGTSLKLQSSLNAAKYANSRDTQPADRNPDRIRTGYKVWRLTQGNENNEPAWMLLTTTAIQDTNFVDTSWASLPDGNYKWAVKAVYTNDVLSVPAFSNMIPILRLDLSALEITGTTTPSVGLAATYQVEVENTGTTTQQGTAYTVKLMSGDTELASVAGVTLAPGETHTFDISWTPATAGPMAITGKVVLPGDAVATNDVTPPLNITVMPAGVIAVTVGDGSQVEGRPVDFYYKNSLFQCLYFPDELDMFGSITALSFYNNFVTDLPNKPTKIWLGQTQLADLSGGWILPPDNLTLVYDGNITYPSGENTVTIPLQTPFNYTGGNLVLYANRPWEDTSYNTNDNFRVQTVGASRARKLTSSSTTYDPMAPSAAGTLSAQFPMTTFHLAAIGNTPLFAINPSSKDFGTVLINSANTQQFTISNAGGGPLTISSISVAGSPFYTLAELPALPATINFGQSLEFTLNYNPTAVGAHTGTITIVDNMARQTHTVSLTANCIDTTINTLPYAQYFDTVTPPALPPDWGSIVQSTSTSALVGTYASTTYAHSQPNCVRLYNPSDANATLILIAPPFATTIPLNTTRVKFWARSSGANYPLSVGVIANPQDPATFTEIQSISLTTTLTEYVVPFNAYTGTAQTIAFKHGLGGTGRSLYLDDMMLELIAANDLAATAITGNSTPTLGQPSTYTVSILNWGTNPQSTYEVKLFEVATPADIEIGSAPGIQVNPGITVQVPVTWTPASEGTHTIYGKVVLTGDQNNLNDQTGNLSVLVQPAGSLAYTVGDGSQDARTPIDMYYRNSIHQYMIYPAEIGNFLGQITGLALYNNFTQDLMNMPINVWIGTTTDADCSAGWIPIQNHTQVFNGTLNFPTGENTITIPFISPYLYLNGQNIVLTFQRPMDTQYYNSSNYFKAQTIGTNRARKISSDSTTYDPYNPSAAGTLTGQFPKTTLFGIPGGVGHLNGTVTGSGAVPLEGVAVQFATGGYSATTNAQGQYQIMNILPDTYTVNFSVYGYQNASQTITIEEDETETLNVTMTPLPMVNVTGTVIASDTQAGISGASIHLEGYADYNANTTANGTFTIPSVYANNSYSWMILAPGYTAANGTINVGAANYSMGTITLNEIAYAPHSLVATANTAGTAVDLTWQAPDPNAVEITESFESDNFPPTEWTQVVTNTGGPNSSGIYNTWCRFGTVTISGQTAAPTDGSYQSGLYWDYGHQDEWLITPSFNCPPAGYLNFDSYVYLGSVNADHYYIQISQDNGITWTPIWDASAQTGGWNYYASPINVDLSAYSGQQVKLAFNATDGPNDDGLWYVWFIDNIYIGNAMTEYAAPAQTIRFSEQDLAYKSAGNSGFTSIPIAARAASRVVENGGSRSETSLPFPGQNRSTAQPGRALTGYKVWRLAQGQESNESAWNLLTPEVITDLTLSDPAWQILPNGSYRWAVKGVYTNNVLSVPSFSNTLVKIQETGMIAGVVRRVNTVPIQGATITAGNMTATSNSVGAYTLVLPIGTYDVTCSATGFQSQTITGVVVNPNQTTTLNFVMAVVDNDDNVAPVTATALLGNYPNPFNPETTISYSVKDASPVRVEIFNAKGQKVRTLVDAIQASGWYKAVWDGRDDKGLPVSSGVYMYRMTAGSYHSSKKMILMQ
jgi:hypothetical protein